MTIKYPANPPEWVLTYDPDSDAFEAHAMIEVLYRYVYPQLSDPVLDALSDLGVGFIIEQTKEQKIICDVCALLRRMAQRVHAIDGADQNKRGANGER